MRFIVWLAKIVITVGKVVKTTLTDIIFAIITDSNNFLEVFVKSKKYKQQLVQIVA